TLSGQGLRSCRTATACARSAGGRAQPPLPRSTAENRMICAGPPTADRSLALETLKAISEALNNFAPALKKPSPPHLLLLSLLFAGITAYIKLPVNQYPGIEFPVFTVSVAEPGAAPAEMETQIAQKVEAALTAVQGVRRVTTSLSPGVSSTNVQLQIGADLSR